MEKYQSTDIVNINDLDSDDEPIGKKLAPGIAKRLNNRKGKVIVSATKKSVSVGPVEEWSKVVTPATKKRFMKRKEMPSIESEYDVKQIVQDIMPSTKEGVAEKKIPANVPEVPINNISFHYVENVEKWKYVYQRRLDLERNIGNDDLECKEVVDLIEEAGLMKSVASFGNCYEMLVKEFIVNISKDCDSKMSKEYMKIYVRGKCVEFSPEVINMFMGRSEEEQDCKMLKSKVQTLLDSKMFSFVPRGLQINNAPSPGHASPSAHVIEEIIENRFEDDYHTSLDEQYYHCSK